MTRQRGIDVCAYYALANGYLTGKYRNKADLSKSARGESVRKYMAGNGPRVLAALDQVANETGHTLRLPASTVRLATSKGLCL